jgi:hypothetical protein
MEMIDLPSAELILALQLGDIDELRANSKGKPRDGELTDAELAMSFTQENLESIQSFIADRNMTQSMAEVVQIDGPLVVIDFEVVLSALTTQIVSETRRECHTGEHDKNVSRPLLLPITRVQPCLAHKPGRYSGGSHNSLSDDQVTQSPSIPTIAEGDLGV